METYYTQTHGTINILSQSNLITTREAGPVVIATITICACALLYLDPLRTYVRTYPPYYCGVNKMSDAKPKLRELALELDRISWAEVKAMAIQLDMEYTTLSNISTANQETSDRIVCAMDTWLKTDPRASWKKIVKALKATNKIVLAQEIEKKYILNAPSSSSTSTNDADTGSSIALAGTVNPLLLTPGHTTTAGEWISIKYSIVQMSIIIVSASMQAISLPSQKLAVNLSERETATDSTHDVVVPETTGMILSTNIH